MRVPTICLAVFVTVILALPEATGAPTNAGSESYKREEAKTKKVAKEGEEQEQYLETTSNANGLVSGSKVHSQDKHNSELEEEQSSSSEEIKTATGLKKTQKTKKQKKVVTSSEHKTVLVYYMVSYKTLPKQRSGESRVDYYKRVFPVEDNLKQFYHKIFKNYENEESTAYIERVEFILNNVYHEYDPRLDVKWLEEFDHYYTLKYSRKTDECDASYYPRILAKESGENVEHYKQRMECLVAALDEEDFTHIEFDDSELGYKIGVKTAKATTTSGGTEEGQYSSQVSTSSKRTKAEEESVDENETTVEHKGSSGISSATKKEVKKKRTTVESEVQSKSATFRMAYNKLPARSEGVSLLEYYKNYFGEYILSELTEEAKDELYLRCLIQYRGETAEEYISRVDFLFDEVYPELDIRTDIAFANLLTHFYRTKYSRTKTETIDEWYTRILKKQCGESAEHYTQRICCLKTALTEIDWSTINIDENSSDGYTVVSRGSSSATGKSRKKGHCKNRRNYENRKRQHEDNLRKREEKRAKHEENVRKHERRRKEHIENVKRFNERKSEHNQNVKEVERRQREHDRNVKKINERNKQHDENVREIERRKNQHDKNVEKINERNKQHEENVKKWIKANYRRKSGEDISEYFKRICKNNLKNEEEYIERMTSVRSLFSDLDLWYDEKYLSETKYYYTLVYSKKETETEEEYFVRLLTKEWYESNEHFAKRLNVLHSLFPSLSVWYDDIYYDELQPFYEAIYEKKETETIDAYLSRVYTKYNGESEEDYWKRLLLIQETFPDYEYWYEKQYLDKLDIFDIIDEAESEYDLEALLYSEDESSEDDEILRAKLQFLRKIFDSSYTRNEEYSQRSCTKSLTEEEIKETYFKSESEDITTYMNRITTEISKVTETKEYIDILTALHKQYIDLPLWYDAKYFDIVKNYYESLYAKNSVENEEDYFKRIVTKESSETDECYVKRIETLQKLYPALTLWSNEDFYEKYFKTYYLTVYKQLSSEDIETYYSRLISKSDEESDFAFLFRLNYIRKTYPQLSLWYDTKYFDLVKKYYVSLYEKKSTETEEEYYKRVLVKESWETEDIYAKRVNVLLGLYPSLSVWSSDKYYATYTKAFYQVVYKKLSSEDDSTYYSRIISQFDEESDITYVERLSLIKRTFPELALWYDTKYIDLVKKYYSTYYTIKSTETEEEFVKRVVTKESCETDETYVKRIEILQTIFPTLSIWSEEKYYKTYLKECYQILYKQLETEDKEEYFSRVVSRFEGESDATYIARLALIQRTYRCLALWYSENYYSLVKEYYTIKYTKLSDESDEAYIQRLVAKEKGDSTDSIYGKRIHLVHLTTISSSVWYDEQYYESFLKSYYESYYKKGDDEKCAEWLNRVITLLDGECECDALKRIALIKKCTDYSCWTLGILSEIESNFSASYITVIKENFFTVVTGSYSSSSSSSTKSSSSSESEEQEYVEVSRG